MLKTMRHLIPPTPEVWQLQRPIAVQGYDIDFAGVVSNIVYVRWLEDLRVALLEDVWPLRSQLQSGKLPVVVHNDISYQRSVRLQDSLQGHIWLSALGESKLVFQAMFCVGEACAVSAQQTCVCVDIAKQTSIPVPDVLRQQRPAERS